MITQWNVLSMLKSLCDTKDEGEEELLPLCENSLNLIANRLKDNADRDDPRILSAAAAAAFYSLTLRNSDSVNNFQAGDISISNSFESKLKFAQKMKDDAMREVYPLFKDEGFYAGSVDI